VCKGRLTLDSGGRALQIQEDSRNGIGNTIVENVANPFQLHVGLVAANSDCVHDPEGLSAELALVSIHLLIFEFIREILLGIILIVIFNLFLLGGELVFPHPVVLEVDDGAKHALQAPTDQVRASGVHRDALFAGHDGRREACVFA
jgi:hypothetical protein